MRQAPFPHNRYLWRVTLDTGHGRRSYRDEVDDAVVTIVAQGLAAALDGDPYEIRLGYHLRPVAHGSSLIATVIGDHGPLVTIAVARKSLGSDKTWGLLGPFGATGAPPGAPWCAVALLPALTADPGATNWLGDYERCLAWAWIEARP